MHTDSQPNSLRSRSLEKHPSGRSAATSGIRTRRCRELLTRRGDTRVGVNYVNQGQGRSQSKEGGTRKNTREKREERAAGQERRRGKTTSERGIASFEFFYDKASVWRSLACTRNVVRWKELPSVWDGGWSFCIDRRRTSHESARDGLLC